MAARKNVSRTTAQWAGTLGFQPYLRDEAAHRFRCAAFIAVSEIKIGREVASEEKRKLLRACLHLEGDLARRSLCDLSTRHICPALRRACVGACERSRRRVEVESE